MENLLSPPGFGSRSAAATAFLQLLDQPDHGVVAVDHLGAFGELRPGLLQAPPEAMQEPATGGAAASDELQVDVGFAERGRASPGRAYFSTVLMLFRPVTTRRAFVLQPLHGDMV